MKHNALTVTEPEKSLLAKMLMSLDHYYNLVWISRALLVEYTYMYHLEDSISHGSNVLVKITADQQTDRTQKQQNVS